MQYIPTYNPPPRINLRTEINVQNQGINLSLVSKL